MIFISIILKTEEFNDLLPPKILEINQLTKEQLQEFNSINENLHKENIFYIKESKIHGKGSFATRNIQKGEKIGILINQYMNQYFVNHCISSNLYIVQKNEIYELFSLKEINKDEELTLNYFNTPKFVKKPEINWIVC
jgi:flagella basal body P-ring formation protein FlgA